MIGYSEIIYTTKENVIADKKDYTDEEWEDEGYDDNFDRIVDYEFIDLK